MILAEITPKTTGSDIDGAIATEASVLAQAASTRYFLRGGEVSLWFRPSIGSEPGEITITGDPRLEGPLVWERGGVIPRTHLGHAKAAILAAIRRMPILPV